MPERAYSDFDIVIEPVGGHYRARVINSPAGQAAAEFDTPFSPLELENFVLRMGRPRSGMRRIDSPEMEIVKTFGTRLFRAVFTDDVYACYLRSLDEVLDRGRGLRIRLRIDVPAFHDLPWEYLYNPQFDQFLALSKDTPIIRYIELPYGTQALPLRTPVRIVVMISSPADYPPLNVEEEWARLNRALQPLIARGQVVLTRLEHATLEALQQHLRREPAHIFHFVGHGKYFEAQQDGMLLLENETGRGVPTSGQYLGAILHDHRPLRLVVLNACEGARTSAEDPYTGVAQTLIRQGIPAVLAMQFEIFENAAVKLAQEFYGAIADGYPVDAALSEARKAIFASANDVEWGTPVLFMRISNGVLFKPQKGAKPVKIAQDTKPLPPAAPAVDYEAEEKAAREQEEAKNREIVEGQGEATRLYDEALALFNAQTWDQAVEKLERALELAPDHGEVKALLTEAQEKLKEQQEQGAQLVKMYNQAVADLGRQDWSAAIALLEQIDQQQPDFRDVRLWLKTARDEKEMQERRSQQAELYDRASSLVQQQDWDGASDLLQKADLTKPHYFNFESLFVKIHEEKAAFILRVSLEALYKMASHKLAEKDWAGAIESLENLETQDPGYKDVRELLQQAREGQAQAANEAAEAQAAAARLDEQYEQARAMLAAQDFAGAIGLLEGIHQAEPGYKSTKELLEYARKEQTRQAQAAAERSEREAQESKARERESYLAGLYATATGKLEKEDWFGALDPLMIIFQMDPNYRDLDSLLRRTKLMMARAARPSSLPEEVKPRPKPKDLPR